VDSLLGNTTRRATGRGNFVQPIIADEAAAEGAGYMTRGTFKQIVETHGVPDPETGLVRLTDTRSGQEFMVDPDTLDIVTPEGVVGGGEMPLELPEQPPISMGETTYRRTLGGTTGGGAEQVVDSNGQVFVEKTGNSEGHIAEEHYADNVYEAMGIPVPRQELVQTAKGTTKRANFIDGTPLNEYLRTASPEEAAAIKDQIQQGFAP
jgi:hypothetical protein